MCFLLRSAVARTQATRAPSWQSAKPWGGPPGAGPAAPPSRCLLSGRGSGDERDSGTEASVDGALVVHQWYTTTRHHCISALWALPTDDLAVSAPAVLHVALQTEASTVDTALVIGGRGTLSPDPPPATFLPLRLWWCPSCGAFLGRDLGFLPPTILPRQPHHVWPPSGFCQERSLNTFSTRLHRFCHCDGELHFEHSREGLRRVENNCSTFLSIP